MGQYYSVDIKDDIYTHQLYERVSKLIDVQPYHFQLFIVKAACLYDYHILVNSDP